MFSGNPKLAKIIVQPATEMQHLCVCVRVLLAMPANLDHQSIENVANPQVLQHLRI